MKIFIFIINLIYSLMFYYLFDLEKTRIESLNEINEKLSTLIDNEKNLYIQNNENKNFFNYQNGLLIAISFTLILATIYYFGSTGDNYEAFIETSKNSHLSIVETNKNINDSTLCIMNNLNENTKIISQLISNIHIYNNEQIFSSIISKLDLLIKTLFKNNKNESSIRERGASGSIDYETHIKDLEWDN